MPKNLKIEDTKPKMRIENTKAVFQSTTTTYNDSSTTYSSSSQVYGGSDPFSDLGPSNIIEDIKPNNLEMIDL